MGDSRVGGRLIELTGGGNAETIRQVRRQAAQNAIQAAGSLMQGYIGLIGIASEGADYVFTFHELSQGNWSAGVGLIPFVPATAGITVKNAAGVAVVSMTAAAVVKAKSYFTIRGINRGETRMMRMLAIEQDLLAGDITEDTVEMLINSGFLHMGKNDSYKYIGDLLPNPTSGTRAHHDLPLEFEDQFLLRGLDPNDPRFCRRVELSKHLAWHKSGGIYDPGGEFNHEWRVLFASTTPATRAEILEKFNQMRTKFQ